jgi:hypothetical protein
MLIVLDSTTRKLQAKMSMAAMDLNCSVTCTYGDSTSTTFVEGIYPSTLNGTTLVDILPAPAASTRRVVKSIILFNDDTDTHTITLYLADGAASYPITKVTLAPGASWASDDQSGINIGGAVTDGSKGDINVSGGGTTWTIATSAVNTSKMGGDITAAGKALLDDANASAQRTTLGLGSIATQNSSSVSITGGSIAGITDLAIADGGTGQSTRQSAMDALAGSVTNGQFLRGDGANVLMAAIKASDVPTLNQNTTGTASNVTGTVAVVNGGTGATTASDARTNLGLGTIATQSSSNVTITGGSIAGITDLAVADGGTGASTAANALTNLGAYPASNPSGYTSNTGTVTSVGGTGTVNGITLTGSVTTSGNLTLGGTLSNVNLASQVTGTLPIANGGTGLTATPTNGQIDIGNGTGFARTTLTAGSNITITNGAGTITIASTSSGVTDTDKGDIVVSGGGTVWTIDSAVVSNAKLATMNANTIKARVAGSTGAPEDATLTQVLDLTGGSAQGSILYRGASTWTTLAPGTTGQFLRTNGFAGNPEWNTIPTYDVTGTNTGDQNVFSVVAVAGQPNIVADTTSDTLTIASDSNITVTTNATSDTLTIALTSMNASTIKARITGSTGAPEDATITQVLDLTGGSAQGSILYRGASTWTALAPGTSGQLLQTQGAGANPAWATISTSGLTVGTSAISGGSSGRVLYNNSGVLGELGTTGSGNVVLATGANVVNLVLSGTLSASGGTGTSGQVLQSTGSGVQWAAGGGDSLSNSAITPTTNQTAASSTRYTVNLSSLSADIDFILPTPSAANEVIEVSVSVGNSNYEMFIRSETGAVTINGGRYAAQSVTASTADTLTLNAHPLLANDPVSFSFTSGGSMPGGLTQNTIYYVRDVTTNTFKVATTRGGAAVDITSTGSNVTVTRQEWTRLFIPGETLEFRSTSTTNWSITKDGRIPNICRLGRTSVQSITHNTSTIVRVDTVTYDNANMNQIGVTIGGATADGIKLRRPGRYLLTCGIRLNTISATINQFSAWMTDTLNVIHQFGQQYAPSGNAPGHALVAANEFIADVTIYMRTQQTAGSGNTPGTQDTSANPYPHLSVTEILG